VVAELKAAEVGVGGESVGLRPNAGELQVDVGDLAATARHERQQ
jgi:hypothetical protein